MAARTVNVNNPQTAVAKNEKPKTMMQWIKG